MSQIRTTFEALEKKECRGLIPFITAGDPDLETTRKLVPALARAGADIIELGVPFSDPIADGPVIQRASQRALRQTSSIAAILDAVKDMRREVSVPIVIFSYLNPLLQFGVKRFAQAAAAANVDGVLLTDLPLEEAGDFAEALSANGIDLISLISPTSSENRLRVIANRASGFLYAVSRTGVTGTRDKLSLETEQLVTRVRAYTDLPVAVGFGISNAAQVAEVWRYADAAVVGSAIVSEIEKNLGRADLIDLVEDFVRSLKPQSVPARKINRAGKQ